MANQTVEDSMSISALQNATQGTYLVELNGGLATPLFFILSVWNGHAEWPVFPMLAQEANYIVLPATSE
jgi:hypothetical protein